MFIAQKRGYIFLLLHFVQLTGQLGGLAAAQAASFPQPEVLSTKQGLPQGFIPSILQDSRGFIWIATRDGLCRFDGRKFSVYRPGTHPSLSSLGLEGMQIGPDNKIWIAADQGAIDIFDPLTETVFNYSSQSFYQKAFGKSFLRRMYLDKQNRMWLVFNEPGIACIDLATNSIQWYRQDVERFGPIAESVVRDIHEDKNGTLWVATRAGLFRLLKGSETFEKYKPANVLYAKIDKTIYATYDRPNGEMLVLAENEVGVLRPASGDIRLYPALTEERTEYKHDIVSDSQGNSYFYRMHQLYRFSDKDGLQLLPVQTAISEFKSLYVDRSDVLWAGSNGQGVRKYNLRAAYFKASPYRSDFITDLFVNFLGMPESERSGMAADMFSYNFRYAIDPDQNIWFNDGRTPFYKFDPGSKSLSTIRFPFAIDNQSNPEQPVPLAADPDGRMWAVHDTLAMFYEDGAWHPFRHRLPPGMQSGILQIVVDKQKLWMATASDGLYNVDRENGMIAQYRHNPDDSNSLGNDNLYGLFSDPLDENLLWIGTFGGGLCSFNKQSGLFRRLTRQQGLPNDVVYAAIPDCLGNVWVATNQGLSQVNRNTFKVLRTYTREDGLMADEFNRFHSLRLADDRIFLGGVEGITTFDPAQSNEDDYHPPVFITSISVNNNPVSKGRLTKDLPVSALSDLTLNHDQNFIAIGFAAMQFNRSDHVKYRYQLAGLEDDWIETEEPVTNYTDLAPGNYTLRLNASNTAGTWSDHIATLHLVIHPPWWRTWWAYLLYALVLTLSLYGIVTTYVNRLKLKQSIAFSQKEMILQQKEAAQLRELDHMKTRFFSNITHEFRTPLTLILAPADQMLQEPRADGDSNRLSLITRNAQQLLGLVNQLLDLSKLESGTIRINETQGDPADFVGMIVRGFENKAQLKNSVLGYENDSTGQLYWFDHEKLERVLNNLISNAIKFTGENGRIRVALQTDPHGIQISVSDDGTGIPKDKAGHVFDRFYQVGDQEYQEGSGIGLAIVKELVELQNGSVALDSDRDGFKTVFTVKLPYRIAELAIARSVSAPSSGFTPFTQATNAPETASRILLVEDNEDLAGFITASLARYYLFFRASNGREGMAMALEKMPDLIISDVMMPVMDGYAFCDEIKSNLQTSHIPVILLTAKSAVESRLEGLRKGADDYITKPFHLPELSLRIRNLLQAQQRLGDFLTAQFATTQHLQRAHPEQLTDPFLVKLYEVLEANLDKIDFGVNELVREIGMSNTSLNRKLKALTNLSAVEVMRNYRLKKAAQYLSDGMQISQAAYEVGFDNLSYFAKCFRDLFQMSPREFTAKHKA